MKTTKFYRLISILLALVILTSSFTFNSFAKTTDTDTANKSSILDWFWDLFHTTSVSVSGLPEGAEPSIEKVSNPFNRKSGSSAVGSFLGFYDIKATDKETGKEIHPNGEFEVRLQGVKLEKDQSVYVIHVLDTEDAIKNTPNVRFIDDAGFVNAFKDQAKITEKATGIKGVVAVEMIFDVDFDGSDLSFTTSSFSIFIITEDPRLKVNFYNGEKSADNLIASILVTKGDYLKSTPEHNYFESVVYDPGINLGNTSDKLFRGWIGADPGNAYTSEDADNALTIEDVRTLIAAKLTGGSITDLEEMDFFAMIFRRFTVTYLDKAGVVSLGRDFVLTRETDNAAVNGVNYQINMNYVPDTADEDFKGWEPISDETAYPGNIANIAGHYDPSYQADEQPDSSVAYTEGYSGQIYVNPSWIKIKGDLYLKAYSPSGYWLSFQQNGKGASYTPPQFIETADETAVTVEPADPTRLGYEFQGWFEAAGYETVMVNGSPVQQPIKDEQGNVILSDTAFVFGSKITQRTTLYAKWSPVETAGYTVIIWKERMSDTYANNGGTGEGKEKNYDFAESFSLTGNTGDRITTVVRSTSSYVTDGDQNGTRYYDAVVDGTTISGVREKANYIGFHCADIDQDIIIAPEGTSVVNVYYDRNTVTYTFYTYSDSEGYIVATDENGTQYGLVNGEYVEIRKEDRDVTVWTPAYTYSRANNDNGTQYALIDGEYVELRRESQQTTTYRWRFSRSTMFGTQQYWMDESSEDGIFYIRNGNNYSASGYTNNNPPPANNGVTYYAYYVGWLGGNYYQLESVATTTTSYTWYNGSEVYDGNRYTRVTGGSEYTGKRYLLENGTYSETTGEDGTQYCVDVYGGYVQLNKGTETRTVWVVPKFEAHYEIDNTNGTYGKDNNDEYVQLTPIYEYSYIRTGYTYTQNMSTTTGEVYGVVSGSLQRVYRANNGNWYTTNQGYNQNYNTRYRGNRYTRTNTSSNTAYSGTIYILINGTAGSGQSGFTEGSSDNLYGKGEGDVYFQLETTATVTGYTLNGQPYEGDRYSVTYEETGEKEIYYGPRYKKTTGSGWHIYQANIGLYGETLPWPSDSSIWWYESSAEPSNYNPVTRMTYKANFLPLDDDMSVEYWGRSGNGTSEIIFYTQDLNNSQSYTAQVTVSTSSGSFSINDKFTGFYAYQYRVDNGNWQNVGALNPSSGIYGTAIDYNNKLEIRYNRITGTITFMDGKYFDGNGVGSGETPKGDAFKTSQTYYYEADVSTYNADGADYYTPPVYHDGYVFAGWYADDACTHVYNFTTMPAGGITVYAKWVQVQYRVFLHPGVPTEDASLEWGDNTQTMTFRIDYGEKISGGQIIMGERDLYELVGWYYDPDFKKPFNFDAYELNDTTVKDEYDKTSTYTDYMGRHGIAGWWDETDMVNYAADLNPSNGTAPALGTTINKDQTADRFWITRVLNLYAKWKHKIEGADGIYLEYDAGDGSFVTGTQIGANGTYSDGILYDDAAHSYGIAATVPPTDQYFRYWSVQKWVDGAYVDTGDIVYPGEMFLIDYTLARQETIENPVDADHRYNYYMRLKAVYSPAEPSTTTVKYDPNGGTWQDATVATLKPNDNLAYVKTGNTYGFGILVNERFTILVNTTATETITREGYVFKGWSFYNDNDLNKVVFKGDGTDPAVAADNLDRENGNSYPDDNENTLYAVWDINRYKVNVEKILPLTNSTYTNAYEFTFDYTITYPSGYTPVTGDAVSTTGNKISVNVPKTIEKIPHGSKITVTERLTTAEAAVFNVTYNIVTIDPVVATHDGDLAGTIKITNTFKSGKIKITKALSAGSATNEQFMFRITGGTLANPLTVTVKAGKSVTVAELQPGTYKVTELTDWSWRYDLDTTVTRNTVERSVVIDGGETEEVTFTNKRNDKNWLYGENAKDNAYGN